MVLADKPAAARLLRVINGVQVDQARQQLSEVFREEPGRTKQHRIFIDSLVAPQPEIMTSSHSVSHQVVPLQQQMTDAWMASTSVDQQWGCDANSGTIIFGSYPVDSQTYYGSWC